MKIKALFLLIAITMLVGTSFAKKPKGHDEAATKIVEEIVKVAESYNVDVSEMYILFSLSGWDNAYVLDDKGKSYELTKDGDITNNVDDKIKSFMKECDLEDECYDGMRIDGIDVYRIHDSY